jgi:hypothetical protein
MKSVLVAFASLVSTVAFAQAPALDFAPVLPPICFTVPMCLFPADPSGLAPPVVALPPPLFLTPPPIVVIATRSDPARPLLRAGGGVFGGFHAPLLTAALTGSPLALVGSIPIFGSLILAVNANNGLATTLLALDTLGQVAGIALMIAGGVKYVHRRVAVMPTLSSAGVGLAGSF